MPPSLLRAQQYVNPLRNAANILLGHSTRRRHHQITAIGKGQHLRGFFRRRGRHNIRGRHAIDGESRCLRDVPLAHKRRQVREQQIRLPPACSYRHPCNGLNFGFRQRTGNLTAEMQIRNHLLRIQN